MWISREISRRALRSSKRDQTDEEQPIEGIANMSDEMDESSRLRYTGVSARTLRSVHPLGMRVLIKLRPDSNMSEGGLYLPEGAKSTMQESLLGEVVEVASAVDTDSDEETNISGIPLGALVLIPKKAGVTVPWDDELRIVDVKDVLAIVSETDVL